MDDLRVEDESFALEEEVATPPRDNAGRASAIWVSLGLVLSLVVSLVLAVRGEAEFAFRGMVASAYLTNAIVVMSFALGVPLAAIVGWVIRDRRLMRPRGRRWGPLVTACVIGEPEIIRESCVLADGSRGVAPAVVIRAETGRVSTEDLVRVAMAFWRGDGYDPHADAEQMAYISGVRLEDPYVEVLVVRDVPRSGFHELSYHAVCMKPAA